MSVNLVNYRPSYQTLFVGVAAVSIVALLAYAFFSRKSSQQPTPEVVLQPTPTPLSTEQVEEINSIRNAISRTIPLVDKLNNNFPFELWKGFLSNAGIFSDPQTSAKVDLKRQIIQLDKDKINVKTLDKICQYMTGSIICSYNSGSSQAPECKLFYRKEASSFVYIPPLPPTSSSFPKTSWVDQCKNSRFASDEDKKHAENENIYCTLEKEKGTTSFIIWDNRSGGSTI